MIQHILIIKHGALGDLILATGAMKAIREKHSNARITLLTTKPYDALMANCPFIDHIEVDPKPKLWQLGKLKELKRLLQSESWEWVYDLQTSQRSTTYFPLLNTRYYSGLSPKGSHPHLTIERTSLHTLDRIAQQLEIAGIPKMHSPDVSWLKAQSDAANEPKGAYVLLVPGGAPHRPAKRWPHYSELAQRLIERGMTPVLIGTQAEESILQSIEAYCASQSNSASVMNLMNQTSFAQLASLARRATYAVGNDTGPMHLIAAAGCPGSVIFNVNESNPDKSAPRGDNVTIFTETDLANLSVDAIASTLPSHI